MNLYSWSLANTFRICAISLLGWTGNAWADFPGFKDSQCNWVVAKAGTGHRGDLLNQVNRVDLIEALLLDFAVYLSKTYPTEKDLKNYNDFLVQVLIDYSDDLEILKAIELGHIDLMKELAHIKPNNRGSGGVVNLSAEVIALRSQIGVMESYFKEIKAAQIRAGRFEGDLNRFREAIARDGSIERLRRVALPRTSAALEKNIQSKYFEYRERLNRTNWSELRKSSDMAASEWRGLMKQYTQKNSLPRNWRELPFVERCKRVVKLLKVQSGLDFCAQLSSEMQAYFETTRALEAMVGYEIIQYKNDLLFWSRPVPIEVVEEDVFYQRTLAEIDLETTYALIEVTSRDALNGDKVTQIADRYTNPAVNFERKPIIVFAPRISSNTANKFIEQTSARSTVPIIVVHTLGQLRRAMAVIYD